MTPTRTGLAALATCGAFAFAFAYFRDAGAQRVDPRRPSAFVVGAPVGASPMQRVDGKRTGLAKDALPSGTLRIAWRKTVGATLQQPALVGKGGLLAVVSTRGDVVFIDGDGEEKAHVSGTSASAGPATMTSAGSVVFATSSGDAVGVRSASTRPQFVTRIGGEGNVRAAPLALDDGGVVLATATDLVVLDSEGNVRTRVTLPESPAAPLLAMGDSVLAVTSSGVVYGWTPGREASRLGSFGAPIDGGAALVGASLVAVAEGNQVLELSLATGARSVLALAPQGFYLGPPSVRGGASGSLTTVLALTHTRGFAVTIDPAGQETQRASIMTLAPATLLPDGGAPPLIAPAHVGTIVDAHGAIAFAATDGHVGVASAQGLVHTIGEPLCVQSRGSAGVAGLTPLERGAFVVTCEGGVILKIVSSSAAPTSRPSPGPDNDEP